MYERLPFTAPVFASIEDMAYALKVTHKGVKARATRQNWLTKKGNDGKVFYVVSTMPVQERYQVIQELLDRDGKEHDFFKTIMDEYSYAMTCVPSSADLPHLVIPLYKLVAEF